ncbi:MAG: tetratricopeptide repeat protein [Pirellulales bacterium]
MLNLAETLAQAQAYYRAGHLGEAERCCRQVLEVEADHSQARFLWSIVLERLGRIDEAMDALRGATGQSGASSEMQQRIVHLAALKEFYGGNAFASKRQLPEAAACFQRAVELKPDFVDAHSNLGAVLGMQGDIEAAVACFQRAVELKPDSAAALMNLGTVLARQEQLEEAAAVYRRVLALKPDLAEAHTNLGVVLEKLDLLEEAAESCRQALHLNAHLAAAHNCLGAIRTKQNKLDDAVACFQRALEIQPDYPEATTNLASLLAELGRTTEAAAYYQKALALAPHDDVWRVLPLSLCPSVFADSAEIAAYREQLTSALRELASRRLNLTAGSAVSSRCRPSYFLLYQGHDDRPIRESFAQLFRGCFSKSVPLGSRGRRRIGLVVTNGHERIFIRLLGGVLEHVRPDLFELVLVGSRRGIELMRTSIANPAVSALPIPGDFNRAVDAIRAAQFDVLYFWEVGSDSANYFLPLCRLAPVQCTSWGVPATSGMSEVDHYISSELIETADATQHYTERLLLMRSLLSYQRRMSLPAVPKTREHFGIAAESHLYLCAQQLRKVHPDFDPIVAEILRRDPRAVVVATEDRRGRSTADQLRRRLARAMPDIVSRVQFVPYQADGDYLSLVAAADVVLDPVHYGGVTTTYDALSFDKPIVTLPSQFQRGRYALGCYWRMEISDCVARDAGSYVDLAVALGTDLAFRNEVVAKIERATPVLFEDREVISEYERVLGQLVEDARRA